MNNSGRHFQSIFSRVSYIIWVKGEVKKDHFMNLFYFNGYLKYARLPLLIVDYSTIIIYRQSLFLNPGSTILYIGLGYTMSYFPN